MFGNWFCVSRRVEMCGKFGLIPGDIENDNNDNNEGDKVHGDNE